MTPRRFVVLVLAVALFQNFLNPQTFEGTVFASAVGVAVVTFIGFVIKRASSFYMDRASLQGRFATKPIEEVIVTKRFDQWPESLRVNEGRQTILFGFMSRSADIRITTINVRPVERYWFRYRNLSEPWPIEFTTAKFHSLEYRRRGWSMPPSYCDTKAGVDFHMSGPDFLTLEKGTVLWFEIEVIARREWKGAVGMRANVLDGSRLLCRSKIETVGDNRLLNG